MRPFALLIALIFSASSIAGLPPTTLSGQSDSGKITTFNFKVPNKQATQVSGGTLIETGNTNLLVNPGFEHSTNGTGWTSAVTSTAAATITYPASTLPGGGSKMASVSCAGGASGGTCVFRQDIATAATIDSLISIFAKTSGSTVKVYSRRDGSRVFNTSVLNSDAWAYYPLQMQMGTTSTGIEVEVTVSASQTIVVALDNGNMGFNKPTAETEQSRYFGSLKYAGTTNCNWTISSSSMASFPADTDCPTPTVSGSVQAPATKLPAFVLPAGSPLGTYQIISKGSFGGAAGSFHANIPYK